jgi:hypothetical protein
MTRDPRISQGIAASGAVMPTVILRGFRRQPQRAVTVNPPVPKVTE